MKRDIPSSANPGKPSRITRADELLFMQAFAEDIGIFECPTPRARHFSDAELRLAIRHRNKKAAKHHNRRAAKANARPKPTT